MHDGYYQQNVPDSHDSAPLTSFQFSFFVTLSLVHYKFKNSQRKGKKNQMWDGVVIRTGMVKMLLIAS